MTNKANREIVRKLIDAVEHPDNPERKAAVTIQRIREQRQRQSEHIFALIFRLLFIALLTAILINAWSHNGTAQSRWVSLILGFVAGVVVCIAMEKRKPNSQKPLPSSAVLILGILGITISLLVSKIKQLMTSSIITSATILGVSFFLIVSGYAFRLHWRMMVKRNGQGNKSHA